MRLGFLLTVPLFLFASKVLAQEVYSSNYLQVSERQVVELPRNTIKINIPCLLVDPKKAFFISTDTRLADFLSIDMGAGFYFDSWVYNEFRGENIRGIRARLGLKYYFVFGRRLAPYFGFEGMMNRYAIKHYESICRNGCQYVEDMLVKTSTQAKGISTRMGLQIFMGKEKKTFFDFYGGIGLKVVDRTDDLPADAEYFTRNNDFLTPFPDETTSGHYYGPNLILGVYFGYCIR